MIARSYLFAPGHNEKLVAKVFDAGADAVILDLEDAVPAEMKSRARAVVAEAAAHARAVVRINAVGTDEAEADLAAVAEYAWVLRIPKCERPEDVRWVAERAPGIPLICAIESATGLLAAPEIARCGAVSNLGIGGVDLRRDLGLGPGPEPVAHARSTVGVASAAAGLDAPVDGVYPNIRDADGLRVDAESARALGFFGKNAIHPAQLEVIHEVFTPRADEVEWARAVIASYDAAGGAASRLATGELVDVPVARRARSLLELAEKFCGAG